MSYGIKAKNDYGSFIINSDFKNMQLLKELALNNGQTVIPVNAPGVPILAVKNGGGLIRAITMNQDICVSVTVYAIAYSGNTLLRIYTYPAKGEPGAYGLNTYTADDHLAYTSSATSMLINTVDHVSYSYNAADHENRDPVGWFVVGNIDIGQYVPCPIQAYQSTKMYEGQWLVIGTGICNTGGGAEWYLGGTPTGEQGGAVPVLGLYNRNIRMGVHKDLVIFHGRYVQGHSGHIVFYSFDIHQNVITLND